MGRARNISFTNPEYAAVCDSLTVLTATGPSSTVKALRSLLDKMDKAREPVVQNVDSQQLATKVAVKAAHSVLGDRLVLPVVQNPAWYLKIKRLLEGFSEEQIVKAAEMAKINWSKPEIYFDTFCGSLNQLLTAKPKEAKKKPKVWNGFAAALDSDDDGSFQGVNENTI